MRIEKVHSKQMEVLKASNTHRFVVFGAGRRSGKTRLAALWTHERTGEPAPPGIHYGPEARHMIVAPTYGMAEDLYAPILLEIADKHLVDFSKKKLEFYYRNGRVIKLAGCDNPRSLLGKSIISLVGDEMQDWDIPVTWDEVLRPACGDLKAKALFCGTPLPDANPHWTKMYERGLDPNNKAWYSVHCTSEDNSFIDMTSEIEQARADGVSEELIKREFMADFYIKSAAHFKGIDNIPEFDKIPRGCRIFTAVDLQGFSDLKGLTYSQVSKLDETSVATVAVSPEGKWYVLDITYGRWGVRETAKEIADCLAFYKPQVFGVEKGTLKNALEPYLLDEFRDRNLFLNIHDISHGNKAKIDRVFWGLQGRFERGMIHLPRGDFIWKDYLLRQLKAFPSDNVHDDVVESLAMVAKLYEKVPESAGSVTRYAEVIDNISGY